MFHDKTGNRPRAAPENEAMIDTAGCVLCKTSTPPHMHPRHMICDKSSDTGFQNWCSLLPNMLSAACPASPRTSGGRNAPLGLILSLLQADVWHNGVQARKEASYTTLLPMQCCRTCRASPSHMPIRQDTHKAPRCEAHQEYTGSSNKHAQAGLRLGFTLPLPCQTARLSSSQTRYMV